MRDDREAALRANVATYDSLEERKYINGAPHLKHGSIADVYRSLVDDAIKNVGRDPHAITLLELGAGSGLASTPWFERGVEITAVDSSAPMLRDFAARAAAFGVKPEIMVSDVVDFLDSSDKRFDIVTHVSMIHHVPDYTGLLRRSAAHVSPGGCLITFQDPQRYDAMPRGHHAADRTAYFLWRVGQGNLKRGLKTRWRRARGIYSPAEVVDFDEYHVVRNGVDSAAIMALLQQSFTKVDVVTYWSTYSRGLQWIGERIGLTSSFGILASGRMPS